jgi:cellobiose-specific phosphotransferase system component IIA
MQNYFKSTLKNLQNTSFLNTPKRLFISGHLVHTKIIEKRPKEGPMKKILEIIIADDKLDTW